MFPSPFDSCVWAKRPARTNPLKSPKPPSEPRKETDLPRSPLAGEFVSTACEVLLACERREDVERLSDGGPALLVRPLPCAANGAGDTSRIGRGSVWLEERTFRNVCEGHIVTQCGPQRRRLSGELTKWPVMAGFGR